MSEGIRAFFEEDFSKYLNQQKRNPTSRIQSDDAKRILEADETGYVENLVTGFTITPPNINFEALSIDPVKGDDVLDIICHLPFTGDFDLFRYKPSTSYPRAVDIVQDGGDLCFIVSSRSLNEPQVKQEIEESIDLLKKNLENLNKDIEDYNSQLHSFVLQEFRARKEKISKQNEFAKSLGFPIKGE